MATQLTFSDLFFALALLLWITLLAREQQSRSVIFVGVFGSLWLSLSLLVVSGYFSEEPQESATNAIKLVFAIVGVGAVTVLAVVRNQDGPCLALSYATGGAVAALSAISGFGGIAPYQAGDLLRLAGLAGHPVGLSISTGTSIAILFFLPQKRRFAWIGFSSLIAINAVGVFSSSGVTGALMALIGILAAGFFFGVAWERFLRVVAAFVLLAATYFSTQSLSRATTLWHRFQDALNPTTNVTMQGGSLTGSTVEIRLLTWAHSWDRITQHPLVGNGFDEQGQIAVGTLYTHNYILLSWQTGGLLGLAISVTLLLLSVWSVRVLYQQRRTFDAAYAVAGIVATWIGAMSSPALYGRTLYFVVGLAMGSAILAQHDVAVKVGSSRKARDRLPTI